MSDLEKAKKLINDYSINEFGIEEDFENLSEIPVAYTTCDDEDEEYEVELQVMVNLVDYSILYYADWELVHKDQYNSLEEMNDGLEWLDFDELYGTAHRAYFNLKEIEKMEAAK